VNGYIVGGIALVVVLRGIARKVTAQSEQEGKCAISSQATLEGTLVFVHTVRHTGKKNLNTILWSGR
jgi:hypothetical protein